VHTCSGFPPNQHSIAHPGLNFNRGIAWPNHKLNCSTASAIRTAAEITPVPPNATPPDGSLDGQKFIGKRRSLSSLRVWRERPRQPTNPNADEKLVKRSD